MEEGRSQGSALRGHHARHIAVLQTDECPPVGSLNAGGTAGSALISQEIVIACNGELYPIAAVEAAYAVGIVEPCFHQVVVEAAETYAGGLPPFLHLIVDSDFVGKSA